MVSTTTDRLAGLTTDLGIKSPVVVASTANLTLSGEQTIDGVAIVTGQRVLCKDQTDTTENGLDCVDTGSWTRTTDFDGIRDVASGTIIIVAQGTVNAQLLYQITTVDPITIGTSNITFTNVVTSETADKLGGTSATSSLIEVSASKVFTTQTDKFFSAGSFLLITSDADPDNFMHGSVVSYSTTTLTMNITNIGGSGTFNDWTIRVSGTQGSTSMVSDTTPQLGGNFDANGYQIQWSQGADVASATALPVLTDGNYFDVTGTTTIATINTTGGIGTLIKLHFDGALTLTDDADNIILPGGANITTAAGDEAEFIEYAAGKYRCTNYSKASGEAVASGGFTSVQVFTATGTWTRPSGITKVVVEVQGAGGGGAGADANEAGSGGGAGGYSRAVVDVSALATIAVTIGAKGTGGVAGADGTNGGTTSFNTHAQGTGGTKGTYTVSNGAGGIGGVGSLGDLNMDGGGGTAAPTSSSANSAQGGSCPLGFAGAGGATAGGDGNGYGSGGGGARNNAAGGDGADGVIIVWEYK